MKCSICGEEMETIKGAAFEIQGWEQDRDQGGTNHVLWRERTGKIMCSGCVSKKKYGVSPAQMVIA